MSHLTSPTLYSLQVGLPQAMGEENASHPMDRRWRSGFLKTQVTGPVNLGITKLAGDGQADLRHHGGLEKAVCVYPHSRYAYWEERLERPLSTGAFGENFTVSHQDEDSVCIGDVYAVGEALVQVSQPRSPCWKLARRWRVKALSLWVQQTGFTGWYFRVLQAGHVEAGQELLLQERPSPEWTITRTNQIRYDRAAKHQDLVALAACEGLTEGWRERFMRRATQGGFSEETERLVGENRDA